MSHSDISNAGVAALLYETAELLELSSENQFRIRAYQKAARIIDGLGKNAAAMSREELLAVNGIGKGIAAHISAIKETGAFPELEELRKKFPPGLREMLKVEGIGAKRARLLYEKLGVDSPAKLRAAARSGEIEKIEGLGEKLQENILAGSACLPAGRERVHGAPARMLYWPALKLAGELIKELSLLGFERAAYAGSLRRGRETVGDIDLLAAGRPDGSATGRFAKLEQVERVLALGPAKASVRLKAGIQCDFRIVPGGVYGAALNYFTGSKEHNIVLRELARKKGLSLSEYGLCRLSDAEQKYPLAAKTEQEIYEALGLQFIPPELREGAGEVELASKKLVPELVTLADIKGDAHNHTDFSDGQNSMEEMVRAAAECGFSWYFAGDHSKPLGVVHGLDFKEYSSTRDELSALASRFPALKLGRSIEMEILKDGSFGFTDKEAAGTELVIGAVHSSFKLAETAMTERMLKAMQNPYLDAVAHPSGRLIGRRDPAGALDYPRLFQAAARTGTAFEINGQPDRQDLTDLTARMAGEAGVKILLSTDAHSAGQLAYMSIAVTVARRAGLTRKDLLNSLSYGDFCEWIRERRSRALKGSR